jgi:hypothetical protein
VSHRLAATPLTSYRDALGCIRSDKWLDWLEVMKFDWSEFVIPGPCLVGGFKARVMLRGLVPLLLMSIPLVFSIVWYMISYGCARIGMRTDRTYTYTYTSFLGGFKAAALRALPSVILISFCLVQSVSAGMFSAWDCIEFMLDPVTSRAFLREDLSIECGTEGHAQVKNRAYVFLSIWPLGMPLLYLLMLLACRDALVNKIETPLARATSFLHAEFESRFFWWEVRPSTERRTLRWRGRSDVPSSMCVSPSRSSCSSASWSQALS